MKVVILAGGYGTRISEESQFVPKPMIEVGGMPIMWHIMKLYSHYGFNEFVICAGYKQQVIKQWFSDYFLHTSDVTFDFTGDGEEVTIHQKRSEPWKVTVVDTGLHSMTGLRLKNVREYLGEEAFLMTYGDGVSNVNIEELVNFHKEHKKLVTLSAIKPGSRFGVLDIDGDMITAFREKSMVDSDWINGGFMVVEPQALDYVKGNFMFENEPLEEIATIGQLACYKHYGFWQCMDTMRDKEKLEEMWANNNAEWRIW
jgi:glucose-1-phosphate cytidylyltransferase